MRGDTASRSICQSRVRARRAGAQQLPPPCAACLRNTLLLLLLLLVVVFAGRALIGQGAGLYSRVTRADLSSGGARLAMGLEDLQRAFEAYKRVCVARWLGGKKLMHATSS